MLPVTARGRVGKVRWINLLTHTKSIDVKSKYRNIFLIFGLAAIGIMMFSFDVEYDELLKDLARAGFYLPVILLLWLVVYLLNAFSWYLILRDSTTGKLPFWRIYKYTITGFALNYVTPVGLMGGEPYRIMEIAPFVGTSKATSSVILYVMMHIFSHICFWLASVGLYIILCPVGWTMGIFLSVVTFCCLVLVYFFIKGYKNGMAFRMLYFASKVPFLKKWASRFLEEKKETLLRIDAQIAQLHQQHKRTFYGSLSLEFIARVVSCLEVFFILNILTTDVSFADCILIVAFSSLIANLFFFSPMQLGAREGGFALATGGLAMSGAYGVYTALITRVRELVWIVIGIGLMKIGNKK